MIDVVSMKLLMIFVRGKELGIFTLCFTNLNKMVLLKDNRTLMEMSRSMVAHLEFPLTFLGGSFVNYHIFIKQS